MPPKDNAVGIHNHCIELACYRHAWLWLSGGPAIAGSGIASLSKEANRPRLLPAFYATSGVVAFLTLKNARRLGQGTTLRRQRWTGLASAGVR